MKEDLNIIYCLENCCQLTSPDKGENYNFLIGFAQAQSSKGSDQAYVILNLLYYYEVVDQMFAICCDTTSTNTGAFSGAISVLSSEHFFSYSIIYVRSTFPTS
jgi:hypothetical protein